MKDWAYYACSDGVVVAALYDALRDNRQPRDSRRKKALAGLSPDDGRVIWKSRPAGGIDSIAIGEGSVFFSSPVRSALSPIWRP